MCSRQQEKWKSPHCLRDVSCASISASVWGNLCRMPISLISLGTLCIYVYCTLYICTCVFACVCECLYDKCKCLGYPVSYANLLNIFGYFMYICIYVRYTYVHVYVRVCVSVFMTSASVWGNLYANLLNIFGYFMYICIYQHYTYICACVCVCVSVFMISGSVWKKLRRMPISSLS